MNLDEILNKTFHGMPSSFTTHEFNRKAIENGYPENDIKNGSNVHVFLRSFATNGGKHSKSWTKSNDPQIFPPMPGDAIESAIAVLKNAGYKVLKPVTEFTEI